MSRPRTFAVRAAVVSVTLLTMLALVAPEARGAFEAAPWGQLDVSGGHDVPPRSPGDDRVGVALAASMRRWEALPAVSWDAVTLRIERSGVGLAVAVERLGAPGYGEELVRGTLARPERAAGWGGGVSGGWARWGAGGRRQAFLVGATAGWRGAAGPRVRAALEAAPGPGGRDIADRFLVAAEFPLGAAWSAGVLLESLGATPRWHIDAGCRLAALALACRITPADGSFAFGVAVTRGALALEVSRTTHPRLGAVTGGEARATFGRRVTS